MNDEELNLVMVELEVQGVKNNVYRYRLNCGVSMIYYMLDFEKMENGIIKPIYLEKEDIENLEFTEKELFEKFYWNTVMISQPEIILFTQYLKELIPKTKDKRVQYVLSILSEKLNLEHSKEKLWCITNSIRERGSFSGVFIPLLRKFCEVQKRKRLLLGFGNNDFVFLYAEDQETEEAIYHLTNNVHHILENAEQLTECRVLLYDYDKDMLLEKEYEER